MLEEATTLTTLILPGLSNSGPEHWQSYWERLDSQCRRVHQDEWDHPRCADGRALPFRSVVVASEDDVYVTLEQARSYAESWGSAFVNVGAAGHINSASNLGDWPAGYALLQDLQQRRGH